MKASCQNIPGVQCPVEGSINSWKSGANPSSASSELSAIMNSSELAEFQTYSRRKVGWEGRLGGRSDMETHYINICLHQHRKEPWYTQTHTHKWITSPVKKKGISLKVTNVVDLNFFENMNSLLPRVRHPLHFQMEWMAKMMSNTLFMNQ